MKKKWLIGFASAAMVVTLCFGFAACGGGKNDDPKVSDADIVADMKDTLDLMYADESPLTPVSYTVTHSVKLNGKDYTVDWSVEAVTEGITLSDFVEVGAVDEAKNTVTIEIKKTTQVVDYTIEGTFTVGEETGSVSYDRQIPQIYDVAGVKALVNDFSNQQYYKVDDEVVEVVVKGYVVSTGEWASKYNNFQKVYIADTPTETNKSNECQVYGLILDNVYLTKQEDLVEGAEIIVAGALQYYYGPEITFYNDKNIKPRALYYKLPDLSDEDIVDRALAKLSIPSMFIKEGTYTLPTELEDATITWAVTAGSEYASVSGGTLTLSNLPTDPADVTLTATVTKGNSHKDKPFTVKVYKSNITHAGTQADPYTPAEADELAHTLAAGTYYEVDGAAVDVYVKGKVVECKWAGDTYGNFNYVYLIEESAYTADVTKDSDGVFMVYRIKKNAQLPNENSLAKGDTIVVKGNLQNFNGTYQLGHKDDTTSSSELIEYKSSMTAAEKVAAAIEEAKAAIPATLTADFNLPTSRFADVTLTFTSDKQDVIKVEGGKLTVTRPTDADATVTITVKATCGTDEKSETVSVTVPKQLVIPQDAVTATVTIATYADAHSWTNDKSYATVDIDTNITATMSGTKVGQYALNTGKYNEKSETWRIYQNENPTLKFEAKNGATILTIKITYTIGNTGILTSADKKVNYESDEVIEVGATEFSFSVGQTGTVTNGRVDISAIEVVYSGGTEVHQHTGLTYDNYSNWTHTVHCTGENCDWDNNTNTENCKPVNNECACGHTFTVAEIVAKVKSYSSTTNLPGTYEITGVVASEPSKSSKAEDKYKFDVTVGTETFIAYFVVIKDNIVPAVGDTVTIRGQVVAYKQTSGIVCEFAEGGQIIELVKQGGGDPSAAEMQAALTAELAKVQDEIQVPTQADVTLPTSSDEKITFAWTVKAGGTQLPQGITLEGGVIKVTALPEEETTVILVLTATYKESEVSKDKEVTVTISAAHATDEEKAAAALKSLDYSAFKNAVYSEVNAEGVQLPQTSATVTQYEATVTWSVEGGTNDYVSISANKLCINQLPTDADQTITLKVTVSVNGTNATDTITITVKKEVVLYDITATYDPSKRGHSGNTDQTDKLKDITIALSNKSGTKSSWDYPPAVRVYTSGTIAISVPENYYFTKITLHYSVTESNPVTANVGTLGSLTSGKADWTGTENAVTFTVGGTKGRMDLTSIEFAYKSPTAECTHETVTKTDAIPAECEKPGQEAYWTCTNCNRMFSSETEKTDANEIFVPVATKALNHQFTEWTDKGDGTHHTSTCDLCRTATQEGVHDSDGEGNTCSKCGASVSADLKETVLATFNLGTNGTDSKHNDGSNATTYTETSADSKYTLSISKGVQFYKNAHDAKNNSALKLGSSKNAGSFEFTVPSNVTKVIFYVANYKKNTDAKISINGGDAIALTKGETTYCSDNGEYLAIEVDTSTTKTIKFESGAAGDKRCMIDKIEFMGVDTAAAAAVANAQLDAPVADLPRKD